MSEVFRIQVRWILVLVSVCGWSLAAQEKTAPPVAPSNLKVLKLPAGADIQQVMRTFTAGLGVQCVFCHVQGNFASDENPKKEIARQMIKLTQDTNGKFHDGKLRVSCYTCHRGETEPKTAPEPKAGQ